MSRPELVVKFTRSTVALANELYSYKQTPELYVLRNKVLIACSECPVSVLERVGRYLSTYAEQIYGETDEFFFENSYTDELEKLNTEKRNSVMELIKIIKQAFKEMTPDQRKPYRNLVLQMLDTYLDYYT